MADLKKKSGKDPGAPGVTYASAGVDIQAGDRAVELFKPLASKATRPEVRSKLGGFAGLFALRSDYREPLLAASSDGVGRAPMRQAVFDVRIMHAAAANVADDDGFEATPAGLVA